MLIVFIETNKNLLSLSFFIVWLDESVLIQFPGYAGGQLPAMF